MPNRPISRVIEIDDPEPYEKEIKRLRDPKPDRNIDDKGPYNREPIRPLTIKLDPWQDDTTEKILKVTQPTE